MRLRNLLCTLACSFGVAAQPAGPRWASLTVIPALSGDVRLDLTTYWAPQRVDLPALTQRLPGCRWVTRQSGGGWESGVCQGLLRNDRGLVEGWLPLASLASVLHQSGVSGVSISVVLYPPPENLPAPPPGWRFKEGIYNYDFSVGQAPPPPLLIRLGERRQPVEPLIPALIVLLVPPVIALSVRLRWAYRKERPSVVYTPWIMLGAWFFWFLALPPTQVAHFAFDLPLPYLPLRFLIGAVLFTLPPLLAGALVERLLGSPPDRPGGRSAKRFQWGAPSDAPITLFAGPVLVGGGMAPMDWRAMILGLAAGLAAVAALFLLGGKGPAAFFRSVESGEFHDRVFDLARKAGVRLLGLSLWKGASPREANALASPRQSKIVVVDSLLALLSRRQMDAAVAHELGHLRQWKIVFVPALVWTYLPFYLSGRMFTGDRLFGPLMESWPPFLALAFLLLSARIRRGNEFQADSFGAQIAGDPEAVISIIGCGHRLHRAPFHWSRAAGCILTHPSPRSRALAIAAQYRIPPSRALALLEDAGALAPGQEPDHYPAPSEDELASPASEGPHWLHRLLLSVGALAALLFGWSYLVSLLLAGHSVLAQTGLFLLGLPALYWLWPQAGRAWDRRFWRARIECIRRNVPGREEDPIVALQPGNSLFPAQGLFGWDWGRLFLRGARMAYVGERTRFFLPREAILRIEAECAQTSRGWNHGVVVVFKGGSFAIQRPLDAGSAERAAALAAQLQAWWKPEQEGADPGVDPALASLPFPALPTLPPAPPLRFAAVFGLAQLPLLVGLALWAALPGGLLNGLAAFAAPSLYVIALLSTIRRSKPAAR